MRLETVKTISARYAYCLKIKR